MYGVGKRGAQMRKLWACLILLLLATPVVAAAAGLPFVEDNFAKALAEAKQRKLPVFVGCWAPW
jgi:hypothetical protein